MKREIKFCDSRIFNVNGRIHMMLIHASFVPFIRPVCYMKTFYNKLSVSKIIHNKLLYKHKIITYYIYKSCPKITIKFMQCKSLQLLYIYIYIYNKNKNKNSFLSSSLQWTGSISIWLFFVHHNFLWVHCLKTCQLNWLVEDMLT